MTYYNLFISHSWTYQDKYDGLVRLLDESCLPYKNYSVPKDDPIHHAPHDYQLKAAIRNQMQHASCVLILAGVYVYYSKWIKIEIELAKELGKPIIAVEGWGAKKTSVDVQDAADLIVRWNTNSIVQAIIELTDRN